MLKYSLSEKRNFIFVIFISGFLMGLGIDLYVPSLPIITDYFHTEMSIVQLTISLYMLGYGIGQLFLGVLSDNFGRRQILLISSLLFALVSFLSVLAPNIFVFNMCRFLQGIGIAGVATTARAIAVDCFAGKDLAKTTNYIGISWSLGAILGPYIGGYLQYYFNWQANFYFLGIYGLFVFVYAFTKQPETNLHLTDFSFLQTYKNIKTITTNPLFMCMSILGSLGYSIAVLFNMVGPFLIENILKYSVIEYGQMALLLGIANLLGTLINRFIISFFDFMRVLLFGLVSALMVSVAMIFFGFTIDINLPTLVGPVSIIFFLYGFIVPNSLAKIMSIFPNVAGTASSVLGGLMGAIVSLVTMSASNLKADSQIPISVTYFAILSTCLLLFYISRRIENEKMVLKVKNIS